MALRASWSPSFSSRWTSIQYFSRPLNPRRLASASWSCSHCLTMIAACWTATAVGASIRYRMNVSAASSMKSRTSSRALISAWMSSRSKGVTNVDSSRRPISWLISSPRCSASRISRARCSGRVVGAEHRLEQPGRAEDVRGVLGEHVEEALFAGDEAQSHRRQG